MNQAQKLFAYIPKSFDKFWASHPRRLEFSTKCNLYVLYQNIVCLILNTSRVGLHTHSVNSFLWTCNYNFWQSFIPVCHTTRFEYFCNATLCRMWFRLYSLTACGHRSGSLNINRAVKNPRVISTAKNFKSIKQCRLCNK